METDSQRSKDQSGHSGTVNKQYVWGHFCTVEFDFDYGSQLIQSLSVQEWI